MMKSNAPLRGKIYKNDVKAIFLFYFSVKSNNKKDK
jgi:hypothetical protein